MSNTHGVADTMYEIQGLSNDLLPACIVSTTFPAVPAPPSLTLAAFATAGYVKDGPTLVYVTQEAHTVVLTGGDGQYWLALAQDSFTTYATWNRVAGTHYLWKPSATRPPDVDGLLVFDQLTVAGGVISAVAPLTNVTSPPMSKQNSNAVAITGGTATVSTLVANTYVYSAGEVQAEGQLRTNDRSGNNQNGLLCYLNSAGGTGRLAINCVGTAPSYFGGTVHLNSPTGVAGRQTLRYQRAVEQGITIQPDADTGGGNALAFLNAAGTFVGSITTTSTTTTYNTASDVRLKHAIAPLTAALERVRALRPVSHLWNADDSPGEGFLAHELMVPCPLAVSGQPDEVHPDGSVKPQQVDHSKLVPLLTAGLQAALAQIDALTARISTLEQALGA